MKKQRVMIIDGYNAVHALGMAQQDLEKAREAFLGLVKEYSEYHKMRIYLVWDAYARESIKENVESFGNVSVHYTRKGQTADSRIERLVTELSENPYLEMIVVSRDLKEAQIAEGKDARIKDPLELGAEIKYIRSKVVKTHSDDTRTEKLGNILSKSKIEALKKLDLF